MISRDFGLYVRRDFYEISVSDGPLSHARAHFRKNRILRSISLGTYTRRNYEKCRENTDSRDSSTDRRQR